jgi:ribosomal protein S18 acetylase RimI-like enzyme
MEGAKRELVSVEVRIVHPDEVTDAFAERVSFLAVQLGATPIPMTTDWLRELVAFPKTWLLVAEVEGKIVGMLTLSAFPRVFGWTAWIEGVVTDEAVRGGGIGRALMEKAVSIAELEGFETINLSSRPERRAANALYESLGFEIVPTNYRRLRLQGM